MNITPRRLVRLFSRTWRLRYGAEFCALLEATDLTHKDVLDIVRHAAVEWVTNTITGRMILGLILSSVATLAAFGLTTFAHPEIAQGLPLSAFWGFVSAAMGLRFAWCVYFGRRTGAREQSLWIAAMFLTSAFGQWGQIVGFRDSSVPPPAVPVIWGFATLFMVANCMNTFAMSRVFPRGQAQVQLRKRPPLRPLGLT